MIDFIITAALVLAILGQSWVISRQNRSIRNLLDTLDKATETMEMQNLAIQTQDHTISYQAEVIENYIAWSEGRQPDHSGRLN